MSLSTTSQQIIVEQAAAHLTPQASYIFVGVFAVLCFASIIGQWLKRKTAQIMPPSPTSTPAFTHGG